MPFTHDQAMADSLEYFQGDELAATVFVTKYALRNRNGELLESTPRDMHRRLAREFAKIECRYDNPMSEEQVFELLDSWDVVAQGSPMSAIGNEHQVQSLSNCFVIDSPYDSYGGLLKTDQEQAQIMKRRGGVGFDISTIRPRGLYTANAARTTDGIGVFMERFSNTCREVAQGGRRGALMLTISVHHPEIRTFINIKRDLKKVTGANISIRLTDEFMNAVMNDEDVQLRFPVDKHANHIIQENVKASELWHEIIEAAWFSAEPGLLFWDTAIRRSPADAYSHVGFGSTSTNPCAELILSPGDSCRLLLVNLSKFVKNPFTPSASFDFVRFNDVCIKAQRLMDDLVDMELDAVKKIIKKIEDDPEPEEVKTIELNLWRRIEQSAKNGRRTGLGITALGDTLAYLGVKYGSDESIKITEDIYRALAIASWSSSIKMAAERGAFPVFDKDVDSKHEFIQQILGCLDEDVLATYRAHGRRNIANTTTAPAGSVSIMTQTTSGCEPVYMISYKRRKKINPNDTVTKVDFVDNVGDKWNEFEVYHHGVKKWMEVTGLTDTKLSPYWQATSNDIDWVKKIDLQAAAQKWICHAISNTTNIPREVSVDVVKQIYMRGWQTGCKGVTIYRDGSRSGVLVSSENETKKKDEQPESIALTNAPRRPKELDCDIHRVNVKGESYLVLIGLLNSTPYELFCGLSEHVEVPKKSKRGVLLKNGKKDGVSTYNLQIPVGDDDFLLFKDIVNLFDNPIHGAFTRTISLALRHGVPVNYLIEQLKKDKRSDITSFSNCLARVLKAYVPDGTKVLSEKSCSECSGTNLVYQEGCVSCVDCGSSKCG